MFSFEEETMVTHFQGQQAVAISDANSKVVVAPQYGARLLTWEIAGDKVLFWPEETDWSSPQSVAHVRGGNPILFPFLARHYVDGELGKWRDKDGIVRSLPMHGFARELPFEIVEHGERVLRMRLQSSPQTHRMYPFGWIFDVVYEIEESTLRCTLETENIGTEAMPYYPGHHFYFAIDHTQRNDWTIELPCKTWGGMANGIPVLENAKNTQTTLDDPKLIDRFHLDFTEPRISLTNRELAREIGICWEQEYSSLWEDVTTWTQSADSDFFCVEPWLGLPNAIHHGQGLRWLEPGQKEIAVCSIKADGFGR